MRQQRQVAKSEESMPPGAGDAHLPGARAVVGALEDAALVAIAHRRTVRTGRSGPDQPAATRLPTRIHGNPEIRAEVTTRRSQTDRRHSNYGYLQDCDQRCIKPLNKGVNASGAPHSDT